MDICMNLDFIRTSIFFIYIQIIHVIHRQWIARIPKKKKKKLLLFSLLKIVDLYKKKIVYSHLFLKFACFWFSLFQPSFSILHFSISRTLCLYVYMLLYALATNKIDTFRIFMLNMNANQKMIVSHTENSKHLLIQNINYFKNKINCTYIYCLCIHNSYVSIYIVQCTIARQRNPPPSQ